MTGGRVQQVQPGLDPQTEIVEVLDVQTFDREWRLVQRSEGVDEGDLLWWQSKTGFLTRDGIFTDRDIGPCLPAQQPKSLMR